MSKQDAVSLLREVHSLFSPTFGVGKQISEKHQQGAMIEKVGSWLKSYDSEVKEAEEKATSTPPEAPVQVELSPQNKGIKTQPKGIQVMLEPLHVTIDKNVVDININNENNPIVGLELHRHSKATNAEVFAWVEKLETIVE